MLFRLTYCALLLCLLAGSGHADDADIAAGAMVFKKCAACHTATEPLNKVGPSLMGVVGRPVATYAGYSYSTAMKAFGADGKVWSEAELSDYLLSPKAMVPGTKMSFPGLKKPEDIAHVVAYLKSTGPAQ